VIPPRESAAFVWRMEEVLDLYEEPYDPGRPVVCFEERPCQLVGDVQDLLPPKPERWHVSTPTTRGRAPATC
jgi:hypothetical protein